MVISLVPHQLSFTVTCLRSRPDSNLYLLSRWFWLSWKRSPRLSWLSSQNQCVTWGRSRAPCVGGRTWGRSRGGGHVWGGEVTRRKVDRTCRCHRPSPLPSGFGRRWGIICQWGARERCTLRKLPCSTYDGVDVRVTVGPETCWFPVQMCTAGNALTMRQLRSQGYTTGFLCLKCETTQVAHFCHYCAMYSMCWRSRWIRERRRYFVIKTHLQWLTHDVWIVTVSGRSRESLNRYCWLPLADGQWGTEWTETEQRNQMKMCKMYICICGKCKYVKKKRRQIYGSIRSQVTSCEFYIKCRFCNVIKEQQPLDVFLLNVIICGHAKMRGKKLHCVLIFKIFFMLHSFLSFVFPLSPHQTTDLQTRQSETCNYHVYCICSNNESYKKKS